jgi:hypothetical protein
MSIGGRPALLLLNTVLPEMMRLTADTAGRKRPRSILRVKTIGSAHCLLVALSSVKDSGQDVHATIIAAFRLSRGTA